MTDVRLITRIGLLDVPDDLIETIATFEDTANVWRLVSKRFLQVISNSVRAFTVHIQREEEIIQILNSRGECVRDLSLPMISQRIWCALVQYCPMLETLCVRSSSIQSAGNESECWSDVAVETAQAVERTGKLWPLRLTSLVLPTAVKEYTTFVPLMPWLERFTVHFEDISQQQLDLLASMLDSATKLKQLELKDTGNGQGKGQENLCKSLQRVLPQLTSVDVRVNFSDSWGEYLNPQRETLTKVVLMNVRLLRHHYAFWKDLLPLNLLPHTAIDSARIDSAEDFSLVARSFSSIENVDLQLAAPWSAVSFSSTSFHATSRLRLSFTGSAVPYTHALSLLSLFPNLRSLSFGTCRQQDNIFSSHVLSLLVRHCPSSLQELALESVELDLTEGDIDSLSALPQVTNLSLIYGFKCLTGKFSEQLTLLLSAFPNLKRFNGLHHDVSFAPLARFSSSLISLSLSLYSVRQHSLSLLRSFTRLQVLRLNMKQCSMIVDASVPPTDCEQIFDELCHLTCLQVLELERIVVRSAPLRRLLLAVPTLREITFESGFSMSRECCDVFGELGKNLRVLSIMDIYMPLQYSLSILDQLKGCCLGLYSACVQTSITDLKEFSQKTVEQRARGYEPIRVVLETRVTPKAPEKIQDDVVYRSRP